MSYVSMLERLKRVITPITKPALMCFSELRVWEGDHKGVATEFEVSAHTIRAEAYGRNAVQITFIVDADTAVRLTEAYIPQN
jgi:hypothetical protein